MTGIKAYFRRAETLRRFLAAKRGNVVITFALVTIPIIGFTGAAVDYSRANSAKAAMQASVDATALILSKEVSILNVTQLNQKANDLFMANFNRPEVKNIKVTPTYKLLQVGSYELKLAASGTVKTTFAAIFQPNVAIGAKAEILWGMKRLEIALALDNTGSMASKGKMAAMIKASHNLLDTLEKAAKKKGDIKVAIIPFITAVNVGSKNKNQNWVDYSVNNISKNSWVGCVIDRDQPHDTLDTAPTSTATRFPATNLCGALPTALPLTEKWKDLHSLVDQMKPINGPQGGNTNVTIGLAWAWHALSKSAPFGEGSNPSPDLDKVIILLTDGENTGNRWTTNTAMIDARTKAACTNVKAANIKLYTVRVIEGNKTMLQDCASSPSMFYDVQQADDLNGAFTAISQKLSNLRLAK